VAQQAPPSAVAQQTPTVAQQTPVVVSQKSPTAVMDQQSPMDGAGYLGGANCSMVR
jgi:hypothetical protein